jgi:hypothetical protein
MLLTKYLKYLFFRYRNQILYKLVYYQILNKLEFSIESRMKMNKKQKQIKNQSKE